MLVILNCELTNHLFISRLKEWAVTFQMLPKQKHKFCSDNNKDRSHMVETKIFLLCWNTTAKKRYTTRFYFLFLFFYIFSFFSTLFKIVLILYNLFTLSFTVHLELKPVRQKKWQWIRLDHCMNPQLCQQEQRIRVFPIFYSI